MYKEIKNPLIILAVVSGILLCSVVMLYSMKEAEKEKRVNVQRHLDEVLVAKQEIETKLRDAEIENSGIKANLKAEEEKLAVISKNLEDEKAAGAKTAAAAQEKDTEITYLKAKLAESNAERDKLLDDMQRLNEEQVRLKFYLENIMKTKEEMDKKAKEIAEKQGVSLGTIVINQKGK